MPSLSGLVPVPHGVFASPETLLLPYGSALGHLSFDLGYCFTAGPSPANPQQRVVKERVQCTTGPREGSRFVDIYGTFSPWPLSLVDRADSSLLNVGE